MCYRRRLVTALHSRLVLVVDDTPAVLRVVGRQLTAIGCDVISSRSAEQALRILDRVRGTVDLLLTDLSLPGMDGVALGQEVGRRHPRVAVLYMTAGTTHSLPAWAVLQKPFSTRLLADTLARTVGADSDILHTSSATNESLEP